METAGCPTRSCLAAPETEPVPTTRTNTSVAAERSLAILPGNTCYRIERPSSIREEDDLTGMQMRPASGDKERRSDVALDAPARIGRRIAPSSPRSFAGARRIPLTRMSFVESDSCIPIP